MFAGPCNNILAFNRITFNQTVIDKNKIAVITKALAAKALGLSATNKRMKGQRKW